MSDFRDAGPASRSLLPFGYGDGGGGPTREMVERAHRFADLEGMPRVVHGVAGRVLRRRRGGVRRRAGVVRGDVPGVPPRRLHRADRDEAGQPPHRAPAPRGRALVHRSRRCGPARPTPTTSSSGSGARRCCSSSTTSCRAARSPGCTARPARRTPRSPRRSSRVIGTALAALAGDRVDTPVAFNASPFAVDGVPALGAGPVAAAGAARRGCTAARPARSWRTSTSASRSTPAAWSSPCTTSPPDARCSPAPANLLQLHPDTPNRFDAWDVEAYATRRVTLAARRRLGRRTGARTTGRPSVHVVRRSGPSSFEQWVRLAPGSRRVDFETAVDWQHDETMLKVAFPLAVHADRSTSEIGYGHVHRADAREHRLGRRPVRDLRAPVDPRRRAGVRRGAGQRRHLRPRRQPLHAR